MSAMTDSRVREALTNIVGMIDGCADAPKRPDSLIQMVKAEALAALASEPGVSEAAWHDVLPSFTEMGSPIKALKGVVARWKEWTKYSGAQMGTRKELDKVDACRREAQLRLAEAAAALAWHIEKNPALLEALSRQQPAAEAGALLISASRVREIIDAVDRMGLGPEEFARRVTDEILKVSPPSPSPQKTEG